MNLSVRLTNPGMVKTNESSRVHLIQLIEIA